LVGMTRSVTNIWLKLRTWPTIAAASKGSCTTWHVPSTFSTPI
jgi:hypothetical protein